MNDRHPSGTRTAPAPAPEAASAHYASYDQGVSYGDFTTHGGHMTGGGFADAPHAISAFETDPLFGDLPGTQSSGSHDATQWSTGGHGTLGGDHGTLNYDPYAAQHHAAYETGSYDAGGVWSESGFQHLAEIPTQPTGPDPTGQWDADAWSQAADQGGGLTQQWTAPTFETGVYDATAWNSDGTAHETYEQQPSDAYEHPRPDGYQHTVVTEAYEQPAEHEQFEREQLEREPYEHEQQGDAYEAVPFDQQPTATFDSLDQQATALFEQVSSEDAAERDEPVLLEGVEETIPRPRSANRSRRRPPAKRSALLTVAVPSACVMSVAGIAAASVSVGLDDATENTTKAADDTSVQPAMANNKLDTQIEALSAAADDYADRASRTQERIDLKAEQLAEQKRALAEAARKERLRPKFALPVLQKGLSAYYGQAGINWMSVHTGIDFPVSYGTTVMAATDGTVRTQWNSAYGNMMIVTAKDGTETWYCHLSTYRVASGTTVKAGEPIAYSGNSGNSTGPHLHFEVHPVGGSAVNPLPWLRSHGLDPT